MKAFNDEFAGVDAEDISPDELFAVLTRAGFDVSSFAGGAAGGSGNQTSGSSANATAGNQASGNQAAASSDPSAALDFKSLMSNITALTELNQPYNMEYIFFDNEQAMRDYVTDYDYDKNITGH